MGVRRGGPYEAGSAGWVVAETAHALRSVPEWGWEDPRMVATLRVLENEERRRINAELEAQREALGGSA